MRMNVDQAKSIPLEEILRRYGFEPTGRKGNDIWYRSPFREEQTASFVVNSRKNVWYDHGEGKGGNVIDLVARLTGESAVARILVLVSDLVNGIVPTTTTRRERLPGNDPVVGAACHEERDLCHPALLKYLQVRAVSLEIARRHVREVRYRVGSKDYFGIGFRNESGGYEIRNPYFKGCIGHKDISVVPGPNSGTVDLFEGFMDFLSWPTLSGESNASHTSIVLNSVTLTNRAIDYLRARPAEEIRLFFDRDDAGRAATARIREAFPSTRVLDMSDRYPDSEDVNKALVRARDRREELKRSKGRDG
jgi:hypothetical protein